MKMHKVENLIQEINDLVDLKFDNLQSWVALKKWAIGESRKLSGTISQGDLIYCEVSQSGDNITGITVTLKIE